MGINTWCYSSLCRRPKHRQNYINSSDGTCPLITRLYNIVFYRRDDLRTTGTWMTKLYLLSFVGDSPLCSHNREYDMLHDTWKEFHTQRSI